MKIIKTMTIIFFKSNSDDNANKNTPSSIYLSYFVNK